MESPQQQVTPESELWHVRVMWGLLAFGLLLVLVADPVGVFLVRQSIGNGNYQWDTNSAQSAALTLRILGCLFFMAGLAERIAIEIANLKE